MTETPTGKGTFARRSGPRRRYRPMMVTFDPPLILELDHAATTYGYNNRSELIRVACRRFLDACQGAKEAAEHVS